MQVKLVGGTALTLGSIRAALAWWWWLFLHMAW